MNINASRSKLYISSSEGDAWEMYPDMIVFENRLVGQAAKDVLSNADHTGVFMRISGWDEAHNAVRTTMQGYSFRDYENNDPSKKIFVSTLGVAHSDVFSHVVEEIERITGKKGLIIIVY